MPQPRDPGSVIRVLRPNSIGAAGQLVLHLLTGALVDLPSTKT